MDNVVFKSKTSFRPNGNLKGASREKAIGDMFNSILYWLNTGIPCWNLPE